jgi:outer membrane immunogenic protein
MRRIALALLASTSLLGLASVAEAADLAVRKAPPPPPPPLWSWTGFYIGAHVGAGWSRQDWARSRDQFCFDKSELKDLKDPEDGFDGFSCAKENGNGLLSLSEALDQGSHNAIGGLGGVQVGFNWQAGWVLFGIEAQYSWARLQGDHADNRSFVFGELEEGELDFTQVNAQSRFSTDIEGIGTIAFRLGIVSGPQDRTLFYIKGGAAYAKEDIKERINGSFLFVETSGTDEQVPVNFTADLKGDRSKWGWMFGAGMEFGLFDNWSAKIEYNYLDFGDKDVTLSGNVCATAFSEPEAVLEAHTKCAPISRTHKVDENIQLIKIGLNYRFGPWGKAPAVMAKY